MSAEGWFPRDPIDPTKGVTDPVTYYWVPGADPAKQLPGYTPSSDWIAHYVALGDELWDQGWPVYDGDPDGPGVEEANAWITDIGNVWSPPRSMTPYPDTTGNHVWASSANWNARYQEDFSNGIGEFVEPPGPRKLSWTDGLNKGFPSPRDFNRVLEDLAARTIFRIKLCQQARKLTEFRQHGGRPRKEELEDDSD